METTSKSYLFNDTATDIYDHTVHYANNVTINSVNTTQNTSLQASLLEPPWTRLEQVLFGTWLSVSMTCAVTGNLLVILVVAKHKGMRTKTNMFLVNLAIADFFIGILLVPFALTTIIRGTWIFGDVLCSINGFLNVICFTTSIHTLMYISIHKYTTIAYPFSRALTRCKIFIMISCAWLWAILCGTLTVGVMNKIVYKPRTTQCGPEYPHNQAEYLHHVIVQVANILLPLLIMMFAYGRIYCEIRKHYARLRKNTSLQEDQIISQQIQITKTLFIVVACFMLCWLPYAAYSTYVSMVKDKTQIPEWANPLAYCCMYTNAVCNPIILYWRNMPFRQGFKGLLSCHVDPAVSDDTAGEPSTSVTSHSSIRRLLSRRGSSTVKMNGSIVVIKEGKVISVRHERVAADAEREHSDAEIVENTTYKGVGRLCEATVSLLDPTISHLTEEENTSHIDNSPGSQPSPSKSQVETGEIVSVNSDVDGIKVNRVCETEGTIGGINKVRSHLWNDSLYGYRRKLGSGISNNDANMETSDNDIGNSVVGSPPSSEINDDILVQLITVV